MSPLLIRRWSSPFPSGLVEAAQARALARLLRGVAPTPWGHHLRLDPRMSLADLAALPATGPEDLAPFVARVVGGERRAMWADGAVALVRTTGTTGAPRLLPVTAAFRTDLLVIASRLVLRQLRGGMGPLPRLARWLLVTASTELHDVGGLPAGYAAAVVQDAVRRVRPASALPDPDIAAERSREGRLARLVAVARGARVGTLFGAPADLVALLDRLVTEVGRPAGAVWPALEEIAWTGAHLGPHRAVLERLVGVPVRFREVYGGAEGAFAADLRGDGRLRFVPDRSVFVFEPLAGGPRRLLHEAVAAPRGTRFQLLVTTAAGLVQYRLGDVIEAQGDGAVAVAGRVGESLSAAGEGLMVGEAQAALGSLADALGVEVLDWLAAPAPAPGADGRPRLRFVLEGRAPLAEGALAERLDATLRRVARGYDRARADGRLGAAEVRLLPPGALEPYRRAAWAPDGPVKARPFAPTWSALLTRPGLLPALSHLT